MGLFTLVGALFATIGAGVVAADLTPGVRGVGPATFGALVMLVSAIVWVAERWSRRRGSR